MKRFPVEESKATAGTGTRVTDVTGSDLYYLSPYNSLATPYLEVPTTD